MVSFSSSSSSEDTQAADKFLLKARGKGVEGDGGSEDSRSVSSRQNVAAESSPLEASDEHVSTLGHIHPVAPEPRVNYL